MPVPGAITDLSETPSSNSPIGTESVGTIMNQYIQAAYAFIRQIYDGQITPQGALNFNAQKITNVANGVAATDVATVGQVAAGYVPLAGGVTMTAGLQGGGGFISTAFDAGGLNFRGASATFGAGFRVDTSSCYFLSTPSGSPLGAFGTVRPFSWNMSSGVVTIDGTGAGVSMAGNLNVAGTVTAGNVVATSDERLKTDWAELAPNFVQKLARLKHGTYTRKDTGKREVGVPAQSLRRLLPEATHKYGGRWGVAYGQAAMVSAVQLAKVAVEQEKRIKQLERRLAKLERAK